jgi:hypothetical protein
MTNASPKSVRILEVIVQFLVDVLDIVKAVKFP